MRRIGVLSLFIFLIILGTVACRKKDYVIVTDNDKAVDYVKPSANAAPTNAPVETEEEIITPTVSATINFNNANGMSAETGSLKAVADNTKLEVVISGTSKAGDSVEDRVKVEKGSNSITGIEEINWLDEKQLVITAHINPNLGCLLVYDLEKKDFTTIKYGISFLWKDNDITTLIYILPKPHFSDTGNSVIMNYKDEILYEEEEGLTITNLTWYGVDTVQFEQRIPQTDSEDKIVTKSIKIK